MFHLRCLPLSRGVPTSFYNLMMIFLTNRGTPQYNSPFNQIKALAHNIYISFIANYPGYCPRTRIGQYLLSYIINPCALRTMFHNILHNLLDNILHNIYNNSLYSPIITLSNFAIVPCTAPYIASCHHLTAA